MPIKHSGGDVKEKAWITVAGTLGVRELVGGVSWEAPLRATYTRGDYRKKEECQCRKLEEAMWGPASLAGGRW